MEHITNTAICQDTRSMPTIWGSEDRTLPELRAKSTAMNPLPDVMRRNPENRELLIY